MIITKTSCKIAHTIFSGQVLKSDHFLLNRHDILWFRTGFRRDFSTVSEEDF